VCGMTGHHDDGRVRCRCGCSSRAFVGVWVECACRCEGGWRRRWSTWNSWQRRFYTLERPPCPRLSTHFAATARAWPGVPVVGSHRRTRGASRPAAAPPLQRGELILFAGGPGGHVKSNLVAPASSTPPATVVCTIHRPRTACAGMTIIRVVSSLPTCGYGGFVAGRPVPLAAHLYHTTPGAGPAGPPTRPPHAAVLSKAPPPRPRPERRHLQCRSLGAVWGGTATVETAHCGRR